MNYSEALAFTFRDTDWLKKIAIGGLIAFISFYLGLFFLFGKRFNLKVERRSFLIRCRR